MLIVHSFKNTKTRETKMTVHQDHLQTIEEGAVVLVEGYEMIATNVTQVIKGEQECIRFKGTCTDNPRNDHIRHTGYNGGTYGGNRHCYNW